MKKVLVVDDEADIVELVSYNLKKEGYQVLSAYDGEEALSLARGESPDLVILDLMLPKIDGFRVCRVLKKEEPTAKTPIIMLTAKTREEDRIAGLDLGADDYVTKPFSPRELLARVKAVLRRAGPTEDETLRYGDLEIDMPRYGVYLNGNRVNLTSKEFDLLKELVMAEGRALTRDYLLERVWDYSQAVEIESRTVDVHISNLRRKMGSQGRRIVTVKNVGYRFDAD
jgi:two-component system alkaline phosphatase synthesis response regulator PhoP